MNKMVCWFMAVISYLFMINPVMACTADVVII